MHVRPSPVHRLVRTQMTHVSHRFLVVLVPLLALLLLLPLLLLLLLLLLLVRAPLPAPRVATGARVVMSSVRRPRAALLS